MRVQVAYTVPVEVVLELADDLSTGEVVRVIVADEDVTLDRDDCSPDGKSIRDEDYNDVSNVSVRKLALEIADDRSAVWPAWEFGS